MSVRVQIKESLEASIEFWGVGDSRNVKPADATKFRHFDVHPTKPLILAADRDGKVVLWDYNLKKTLLSSSVASLIIDRANQGDIRRGPASAPVSVNRLMSSSSAKIAGNLAGRPSGAPMSFQSPTHNVDSAHNITANLAPAVLNKIKQQIGQINQVSFADVSYMLSQAGLGGRNSNHFLHGSNSETLIAVVCDSVVLFHDYVTNETTSVTATELSKAAPTSIELAFANTCLIGCSDGVVRMWDWTYGQGGQQHSSNTTSMLGLAPTAKGCVVMAMQTHSKSEVVVVKALPVRK